MSSEVPAISTASISLAAGLVASALPGREAVGKFGSSAAPHIAFEAGLPHTEALATFEIPKPPPLRRLPRGGSAAIIFTRPMPPTAAFSASVARALN